MLSTLARVANQLEKDQHFDLADQVDTIITAIAAREPFSHYGPGDMWDEELEGAEPDQDEAVKADSLKPYDESKLSGDERTYSAVLLDYPDAFKRFLGRHSLVRDFAKSGKQVVLADEGLYDALTDELEHALDEFAKRNDTPIKWDAGFGEVARRLIRETLEEQAGAQA